MNEQNYIRYRKIKAFGNRICFYICRLFPIDKKLICVCTFEGKGGFCCNPRYLVQELHRHNPDYKFVWLVNDKSKAFPSYIKKAPDTLWGRAFWLSRSKVWIDNYRKPYGTCKRKGQYYLNTNHFTVGIKCTGLNRGSGFSKMAYLVNKNDSDMIDALVTDSDWCEMAAPKGMVYDGAYLRTGAPRCDVLYGDREWAKEKFRKEHGLPKDAKVVMFAPTFREGAKDGKRFIFSEIWSIDFVRLIKVLEQKFSGKWYVCVRVHPQLAPTFREYKNPEIQDHIIDESSADDMYEILAGMDAYITDYSSAVFEAGYAKIPSFIYADDIEKYTHDRGSLMWNMASYKSGKVKNNKDIMPDYDLTFPYQIAADNDMLEKNIMDFDSKVYEQKLDEFHKAIGLVFDGKASEKQAEVIEKKMEADLF